MRKLWRISLPLLSLSLFLLGCRDVQITRQEAIERATEINEYFASEEFVVPTRYQCQETIRQFISSTSSNLDYEMQYDLTTRFLYVKIAYPLGDYSEVWIYFEESNDKTYYVANESGMKFYTMLSTDRFVEILRSSIYKPKLPYSYANLDLLEKLSQTTDEETRNVYRSSGEGNLYVELYVLDGSETIVYNANISNYLITNLKTYLDEGNYYELTVDYRSPTMNKPDLADYAYMS